VPESRSRVRFDIAVRTTDTCVHGTRRSTSPTVFAPAVAGSPG